jgi:hypothetical protein
MLFATNDQCATNLTPPPPRCLLHASANGNARVAYTDGQPLSDDLPELAIHVLTLRVFISVACSFRSSLRFG